jgi:hypothetical protein
MLLEPVSPGFKLLLVTVGLGFFLPRITMQAMIVSLFLSIQLGVNTMFVVGCWAGFAGFSACFGIPGGMILGTIVGYWYRTQITLAPDAQPEGNRPLLLGIAAPTAVLIVFRFLYERFLVPYAQSEGLQKILPVL